MPPTHDSSNDSLTDDSLTGGSSRIVLIIGGGIAACKSLELIRRLRERGIGVSVIVTDAGRKFVTPLSVAALSGEKAHTDLFDPAEPDGMDHIRLARGAAAVVVAPATANLLARMAAGRADDLATAVMLATTAPVMAAPAMNWRMWEHPATQANVALLQERGVRMVGPARGAMACGEEGMGRMAEVPDLVAAVAALLHLEPGALAGRRALVTSGPTREPIDPVRHIANGSSGRQGHAIASALAALGAETVLVSGPTALPDPHGVEVRSVETAGEMLAACSAALPVDVAVCAAAVSDWRPADSNLQKKSKRTMQTGETDGIVLQLRETPDILTAIASGAAGMRPALVVGFAAETGEVAEKAAEKRRRKCCDWIVANDVSPQTGILGGRDNQVHLITPEGRESWELMAKTAVAHRLAERIAAHFEAGQDSRNRKPDW